MKKTVSVATYCVERTYPDDGSWKALQEDECGLLDR